MLKSYLLSRKWELIETEKSTPIFCCCKYRQKVIEQISNIVQYWWSMRKAVWTLWQEDRFKSCRKDVLPCRLLRQPTCGGRRRGARVPIPCIQPFRSIFRPMIIAPIVSGKNLPDSVYWFFIKHCFTSTKLHANLSTIVYFTKPIRFFSKS